MFSRARQRIPDVARWLFGELLQQQDAKGRLRYGESLHAHNGRDPIQDALEEAVDLFQYLTQAKVEVAELRAENARLTLENERFRMQYAASPDTLPGTPPRATSDPAPEIFSRDAVYEGGQPLLPVLHMNGPAACKKPAFFHRGYVSRSGTADITKLRLLPDMRVATPQDTPRCGSCGTPIDPYTTQDLAWGPLFAEDTVTTVDNVSTFPVPGLIPESRPDVRPSDSGVEGVAAVAYPTDVPPPLLSQPDGDPNARLLNMAKMAQGIFDRRASESHDVSPEA